MMDYFLMFTTLNIIAVIATLKYKPLSYAIEYVRSTTLAIAIAVFIFHTLPNIGWTETARVYSEKFGYLPQDMVFYLDFIIHFGLVVLIGIPQDPYAILIAASILLIWYALFRNKIQEIYINIPLTEYDKVIGSTVFALIILATIKLYNYNG